LVIVGSIADDKGLKNAIELFRRDNNHSKNDYFHLRELIVEDSQGFANCIKALIHGNSHLEIKLNVNVAKISSQDIISNLHNLALKGPKDYTISLYLRNSQHIPQDDLNRLNEAIERHSVFQRLQISLPNRQNIYDYSKVNLTMNMELL